MKHNRIFLTVILTVALTLMMSSCGTYGNKVTDTDITEDKSYLSGTNAETDTDVRLTQTDIPAENEKVRDEIYISSCSAVQGGYVVLKSESNMEYCTYTDFYGREHGFKQYGISYYSVIPVAAYDKPGTYTLSFDFNGLEYFAEIEILERKFDEQYLEVSDNIVSETLENEEAKSVYEKTVSKFASKGDSFVRTGARYSCPLRDEYRVTTTFGTYRTFSNGKTEYHEAVDMAAKKGTPVYATESGNVIFAEFLQYTGNTVIIDHGMGVVSWYYHLNKIDIKEGDFVGRQQRIGSVGTTGLSTGNHLHFGISVDGIFIDPDLLINKNVEFTRLMEIDGWKSET